MHENMRKETKEKDDMDEGLPSVQRKAATAREKREKKWRGEHARNHTSIDPIAENRLGHTVCTSLWGDGTPGPLIVVVGEYTLKDADVKELNEKHAGRLFVISSGRERHWMDATSTLRMWQDCLTFAFALKRKQLGVSKEVTGMILYDAFGGNHCKDPAHARRRFNWLQANNIVPMELEARSTADMQPCDFANAHFRKLTDCYEDVAFGFDLNPLKRQKLSTILQDDLQCAHRDIKNMCAVAEASLWAWMRLPKAGRGANCAELFVFLVA